MTPARGPGLLDALSLDAETVVTGGVTGTGREMALVGQGGLFIDLWKGLRLSVCLDVSGHPTLALDKVGVTLGLWGLMHRAAPGMLAPEGRPVCHWTVGIAVGRTVRRRPSAAAADAPCRAQASVPHVAPATPVASGTVISAGSYLRAKQRPLRRRCRRGR